MSKATALKTILAAQAPSGAFPSTIHFGDRTCLDFNSFTTAHVLRALHRLPASELVNEMRKKAIAFLLQCESPTYPGAFGFWNPGGNPPEITKLPEDADDTAIITLELARHGYLDAKALCKIACTVLIPHRLHTLPQTAPPWLCSGVFLTWLHHGPPNLIDCCVNANVVALFAYAKLQHLPGYQAACCLIENGIRWAGDSFTRAQAIAPFYPHPAELFYAVRNAVECGAVALEPSLELLRQQWAIDEEIDSQEIRCDRPICGSAYGNVVWTSEPLQRIRSLML